MASPDIVGNVGNFFQSIWIDIYLQFYKSGKFAGDCWVNKFQHYSTNSFYTLNNNNTALQK